MRTPIVSQASEIVRLHASLRTCKSRIASLERKIKRLEAASPCTAHEIEIARLERIAHDIADRWEEAEMEVRRLQRQVRSVA